MKIAEHAQADLSSRKQDHERAWKRLHVVVYRHAPSRRAIQTALTSYQQATRALWAATQRNGIIHRAMHRAARANETA